MITIANSRDPIVVVSWLWGTKYTRRHWDALRGNVSQHLTVPHRFVLITDKPQDAKTDVHMRKVALAAGWIPPSHGCLRRLPMLSASFQAIIGGGRFLHIDLDTVIVRNIDYLVEGMGDFRISRCSSRGDKGYVYGPGFMGMRTGYMDELWQKLKPSAVEYMARANAMGWRGTDQGAMAPFLDEMDVRVWSQEDGVFSYRDEVDHATGEIPHDASIIQLYGPYDPMQMDWDWVKENYRCHV